MPPDSRQKLAKAFTAKNKRKPPPTDVRSGNPRMGKYKGKPGYAIPYSDETDASPYKPGPRGKRSFTPRDPWRYQKPDRTKKWI